MLAWVQMLESGTCCNIRTFSNQGWRYEDVVVKNVEAGDQCDIVTQAYSRLCLNPYLSVDTKKYGLLQSMGFGRAHPRPPFLVI